LYTLESSAHCLTVSGALFSPLSDSACITVEPSSTHWVHCQSLHNTMWSNVEYSHHKVKAKYLFNPLSDSTVGHVTQNVCLLCRLQCFASWLSKCKVEMGLIKIYSRS
jgi:hypothetical protein